MTTAAIIREQVRTSYYELHRAFDAAAHILCDLVIFARDEPSAPSALQSWAIQHNRSVMHRDLGNGLAVLSVQTSAHRHIDVHLLPE